MSGVISYLVFFLSGAMILGIAVLGLNLQWGNTGIFNGGVAAFFGAGAYGLIILGGPQRPGEFGGFGLPFPLAILGGILFAGLLAWLVGVVCYAAPVRTRPLPAHLANHPQTSGCNHLYWVQ